MKVKKNATWIIAGLLSLALVMGLSACSQKKANTSSVKKESKTSAIDVIRLEGGDNGLPNPFRHTPRGPGMSKMWLLYDSLLDKDEKGNIPWLAKSWDVNEDGTVYTFHMQENALWHDGKPLTAEDAVFSLFYYKEHPPVFNDLHIDGEYIVTDAKALDTYTLQVTLNHFDNTYLAKIGEMRILPKHIWENVSDPATYAKDNATVGSGPYKLESYDPQQGTYRYVAFDQYWGLKPAADAIEWVPVSDSVLAFENKEIDLINAPADILTNYQNNKEYAIKNNHSFHSFYLMMNMEKVEALREVTLRKALTYGINRQEMVDKVARGEAMISSQGYVLPVSSWYNDKVEQYEYNLDKARDLLGGKSYSFTLLTDNSATSMKVAELIKLSLEKIGVKITVKSVESKTRDNLVNSGEYELLLINSGGMGGDPDYLRNAYGEEADRIKGWSNPEITDLLKKQAVEQNKETRKDIIFEIQERIADEVPMVMLYGAMDNFVYRPATYDGWMFCYDHSKCDHNKLSYLIRE